MKFKNKTKKMLTRPKTKSANEVRLSVGKQKDEVLFPVAPPARTMPQSYASFLFNLKKRIQQDRLRVVLASNAALVSLYWDIGQGILRKQKEEGWGAKVIDRLSADLAKAFPDMKGFSPRNLKYMRAFAEAWADRAILQRVIAQIPWRSNLVLLDKLKDHQERLWYAHLDCGIRLAGVYRHFTMGDPDHKVFA